MASLTNYPGTITQTTGGSYRTFSNLNNIKTNADNVWATSSGNIKGKSSSPNRPSTITCTNFGFNLPEGAEPTKIITTYRHKKTGSLNIPAPTLTLLGTGGNTFSVKGSAPTTSMVTHQYNCTTAKITRAMVNSSDFGVKINYPANTNSSEGTLSISYVRVTVEYKMPSYSLTLKKASGGYNEEPYTIQASISNTNLTSYTPTLTITNPNGFEFDSMAGDGTYTLVDSNTITWNPQLTSKTSSSTSQFTFNTDVTYPAGQTSFTGDFTLTESLYSGSKTLSATIRDRPEGEGSEEDTSTDSIIDTEDGILRVYEIPVRVDEPTPDFSTGDWGDINKYIFVDGPFLKCNFPIGDYNVVFMRVHSDKNIQVLHSNGVEQTAGGTHDVTSNSTRAPMKKVIYCSDIQTADITITAKWYNYDFDDGETHVVNFIAQFNPTKEMVDSYSDPNFSVLELTNEELNRLGDGYKYIAQSYIKHTTTDTYTRDWYKNNRIGIFNNRPKPLFEDKGVTGNSKLSYWYWNTNYGTGSVSNDGTTFNPTTNSTLTVSPTLTSPATSSIYIYDFPLTVEFDIVSYENPTGVTDYPRVRVYNSANNKIAYWNINDYGVGHYKIVCTEGSQKLYYNGVEQSRNFTFTPTTAWNVAFQTKGNIKFRNFKIYDDSIDIYNLSPQQIYENAEYWAEQTAGLNEYNNVECEFVYDETYPLYVLVTGDYPEATSYGYDMGTIKHTEPCIIEEEVYNSSEPNGTYPIPITALLDSGDISTLELSPNQTSTSVVLYDFPVDETVSTNDTLAIRGFQVRAGLDYTDDLAIQAQLHSPTGEVGNRSILVDSQDEEIVIGGLGDLWGFTTLQMQHLGLWELELSVANILNNSDATIIFNNIEIIFYLETVEKQEITIRVEDEDIAYYGAFIETVKIPEGLNTNTSFLSIDGTDTNDAYRQNIREKTITIEFNLSNCELQTSTDMLRQLTKLFVNEKDQYNRPIPKRIQFSHYPNDYFEYIMEEPFDVDTEITDYNIKASLTIPSGTSYSLYDTITNTTGNANGLAAINPIITIRPSDANIQITENNTDQTFNLTYTGDWYDHTVEIDCEDRKVYIVVDEDTRIDISKYVDYNSDWFRLDGEYDFSSVNCTILSVIFTERW